MAPNKQVRPGDTAQIRIGHKPCEHLGLTLIVRAAETPILIRAPIQRELVNELVAAFDPRWDEGEVRKASIGSLNSKHGGRNIPDDVLARVATEQGQQR